jgi:hypothetical protein
MKLPKSSLARKVSMNAVPVGIYMPAAIDSRPEIERIIVKRAVKEIVGLLGSICEAGERIDREDASMPSPQVTMLV